MEPPSKKSNPVAALIASGLISLCGVFFLWQSLGFAGQDSETDGVIILITGFILFVLAMCALVILTDGIRAINQAATKISKSLARASFILGIGFIAVGLFIGLRIFSVTAR